MQKTMLSVILSSACLGLVPYSSHAESTNDGSTVDNSGFFINGQVGKLRGDANRSFWYGDKPNNQPNEKKITNRFDADDTAYGINLGYRWQSLGVEVGYINLGKFTNNLKPSAPSTSSTTTTVPITAPFSVVSPDSKVHAYTVGVNGHFNLNDNWYISGRAGAFRFQTDSSEHKIFTADGDPKNPLKVKASENGWGPYVGIGFGYDFTRNFGIGINYDYFRGTKKIVPLKPLRLVIIQPPLPPPRQNSIMI